MDNTKPLERRLPNWLDSYIELTANSEPPESFHIWTAISTIAACLQRKCFLRWGYLTFYPNLYIILCAPPGRARKGTAMSFGEEFLRALNIKCAAEAITREALIQELQKVNTSVVDPITNKIYFHSSLTIFSKELTVFLGHQNFQLMSDLTDWYDCATTWTYRTKTQGEDEILGVFVNLIGATTPDLLRTALPVDAIGGGLTSRMIFIYEKDKAKIVPLPMITKREAKLRQDLTYDLEQIHMLQGEFKADQSFLDYWLDWYTATSKDDDRFLGDDRLSGYCERRPNHMMKLAIVHCAARTNSMTLNSTDLHWAKIILTSAENKMAQAFAGVGRFSFSDVAQDICTKILTQGRISRAEIFTLHSHNADFRTLEGILKSLCETRHVREVVSNGKIYYEPIEENKVDEEI